MSRLLRSTPLALLNTVLLTTALVSCGGEGPNQNLSHTDTSGNQGSNTGSPTTPEGSPNISSSSASPFFPNNGDDIEDPDTFSVSAMTPANAARNIPVSSNITVTFEQPILAESYTSNLITVTADNKNIPGNLRQVSRYAFDFTPEQVLPYDTEVTVNVSEQVMSEDGLSGTQYTSRFRTAANMGNTNPDVANGCMDETDIAMLNALNQARSQARSCGTEGFKAAVPSVKWSCQLGDAAQVHTEDMARSGILSHTGTDGSTGGDRINRTGYTWGTWGENIAVGQRSVAEVMQGWLRSDGHCANIMNGNFAEFGGGFATHPNSGNRNYWTQKFATPR